MRPQPHPRSSTVRTIDRHGFQLGPMFDQRVAGGVRLGAREGADRVDEQAAGTQSVGAGGRDGHLESREGGEVGSSRKGKIASTGVSMLRVMPTRIPVPRALAITGAGSATAS